MPENIMRPIVSAMGEPTFKILVIAKSEPKEKLLRFHRGGEKYYSAKEAKSKFFRSMFIIPQFTHADHVRNQCRKKSR